MDYALRTAVPDDLDVVLAWITTPEALRYWGGPALVFPPERERTWREIGATAANSFSLVDPAGNIAGFGQTLAREADAIHLGRIIVAEPCRGQGLGRRLCELLIREVQARHRPQRITLNVYQANTPALALYTALGFSIVSVDAERGSIAMCLKVGL